MRAKDALEGEKKVIARNNERQLAVLEKFSASEKSLNAQLVRARKDLFRPHSIRD